VISVHLSPPHLGAEERALINQALDSNWVAPLGPQVDAFEAEMAEAVGATHAVALSSGTAALHLALVLLGVGRDDEVWTSSLTFAATANPITYVGARPVFLDVHPDTWTLDPGLLEEALARASRRGRMPRAIIAVDLYGQCADYGPIQALCRRYGVALVEDAAEALGSTYRGRAAGTLGDMGVYSFNGNKIITTSGGGMLVCENAAWAERARFLASQARDPAPHYQHSQIGFNYRMSNLLAAVGRGQLRVLEQRVEARRRVNAFYREALRGVPGLTFQPEAEYGRSNCWLTCLQVDAEELGATRDEIRAELEIAGIESRPVWKPLHLQPVFSGCTFVGSGVSKWLFERGLCLPSGSALAPPDLQRIADGVRGCWKGTA
jgi:dTDP-4-amino-4,6-dideoxygalactose transaminase